MRCLSCLPLFFMIGLRLCAQQDARFSFEPPDLGEIRFSESVTRFIPVKMTSLKTTYAHIEVYSTDTMEVKVSKDTTSATWESSGYFEPADRKDVTILFWLKLSVMNYTGNSGKFSIPVQLHAGYSPPYARDTFLTVKGKFTATFDKKKWVVGEDVKTRYFYSQGLIDSVQLEDRQGSIYLVNYYKKGKLTKQRHVGHRGAHIDFKTLVYDFGPIQYAGPGIAEFPFVNTGTEPLIIINAQGSCGCVVPSYPKDPILPGKWNMIKVHYDTKRIGVFEKTVTVTCNDTANPTIVLKIKGEVHKAMTTVSFTTKVIDIGNVNYNEAKTVNFGYMNTGKNELNWSCYGNSIKDEFSECMIADKYQGDVYSNTQNYQSDTGYISVCVKNIFGNAGAFEKKIRLSTNTVEPVVLVVKGIFSGFVTEDSLEHMGEYDRKQVWYYSGGELARIKVYGYKEGSIYCVKYYKGVQLTSIIYYDYRNLPYREEVFKDGKLVENKTLNSK